MSAPETKEGASLPDESDYKAVENKLLLLYLIDKMELPLSRSQVTEHVQQADYMDYYTLQQTLSEMVEGGYLDTTQDQTQDNVTTRYTITGEGQTTLEYFEKHIPTPIRNKINNYVRDHRRDIQRDFENPATYFPNEANNEFKVKCGVYDDERVMMELVITVDSREQARIIQSNWKANAKTLYGRIIEALVSFP